jgi:hypothetical protein
LIFGVIYWVTRRKRKEGDKKMGSVNKNVKMGAGLDM